MYPSRHGVATAANSYYYDSTGTPTRTSGFTYWTSRIGDGQYNFTSAPNTNAPAPWVPFTRAGCNVGAVAMTGFALENTTSDLTAAFGPHPPASANPFADFVGVAVHCAHKALTPPVGPFGLATLQISTVALKAGDATYVTLEKVLSGDGSQRDTLTGQMQAILEGTMFGGQRFDSALASHLLKQSQDLLAQVQAQASSASDDRREARGERRRIRR